MNKQLLCKYLDAGGKSSPVVLDVSLSTSNDQTIYLYHLNRDQIIEYKRDIVEPKLRDLSTDEQEIAAQLEKAFHKARADFVPRGAAAQAIPEKSAPPKAAATRNVEESDEDEDDIGLIGDDDLLEDDDDADVEDDED